VSSVKVGVLRRWGDGDRVAKCFELSQETAGYPVWSAAALVVVGTQVGEWFAGCEEVPDDVGETVGDSDGGLVRSAIEAVAAVGRRFDASQLGPLPGNVHIESWVDQADVLTDGHVVVCHRGSGTTWRRTNAPSRAGDPDQMPRQSGRVTCRPGSQAAGPLSPPLIDPPQQEA